MIFLRFYTFPIHIINVIGSEGSESLPGATRDIYQGLGETMGHCEWPDGVAWTQRETNMLLNTYLSLISWCFCARERLT